DFFSTLLSSLSPFRSLLSSSLRQGAKSPLLSPRFPAAARRTRSAWSTIRAHAFRMGVGTKLPTTHAAREKRIESMRRPQGHSSRRHAFTLVELLVVIAIIGILVALLLPAVQSAREAARRMQCQNNLKQLGLALHNYHDALQAFPPSSVWPDESQIASKNNGNLGPTWVILILPYLEQQALHDAFDLNQSICAEYNRAPRSVQLATMLCPSDGFNRRPFKGSSSGDTSNLGDDWARGNYGANASLAALRKGSGISDGATETSGGWKSPLHRGIMGA